MLQLQLLLDMLLPLLLYQLQLQFYPIPTIMK